MMKRSSFEDFIRGQREAGMGGQASVSRQDTLAQFGIVATSVFFTELQNARLLINSTEPKSGHMHISVSARGNRDNLHTITLAPYEVGCRDTIRAKLTEASKNLNCG